MNLYRAEAAHRARSIASRYIPPWYPPTCGVRTPSELYILCKLPKIGSATEEMLDIRSSAYTPFYIHPKMCWPAKDSCVGRESEHGERPHNSSLAVRSLPGNSNSTTSPTPFSRATNRGVRPSYGPHPGTAHPHHTTTHRPHETQRPAVRKASR